MEQVENSTNPKVTNPEGLGLNVKKGGRKMNRNKKFKNKVHPPTTANSSQMAEKQKGEIFKDTEAFNSEDVQSSDTSINTKQIKQIETIEITEADQNILLLDEEVAKLANKIQPQLEKQSSIKISVNEAKSRNRTKLQDGTKYQNQSLQLNKIQQKMETQPQGTTQLQDSIQLKDETNWQVKAQLSVETQTPVEAPSQVDTQLQVETRLSQTQPQGQPQPPVEAPPQIKAKPQGEAKLQVETQPPLEAPLQVDNLLQVVTRPLGEAQMPVETQPPVEVSPQLEAQPSIETQLQAKTHPLSKKETSAQDNIQLLLIDALLQVIQGTQPANTAEAIGQLLNKLVSHQTRQPSIIKQHSYDAEASSITSTTMQTPNTSSLSNVVTPESKVVTSVAEDVTSESKVVTSVANDVTSKSIEVTNDATTVSNAVTSVVDDITFASNAISSVSSGATFVPQLDKKWILKQLREELYAEIDRRFNDKFQPKVQRLSQDIVQTSVQSQSLDEILALTENHPKEETKVTMEHPSQDELETPVENKPQFEILAQEESQPDHEIEVPIEKHPQDESNTITELSSRNKIQGIVENQSQNTIVAPVENQSDVKIQAPLEGQFQGEGHTTVEHPSRDDVQVISSKPDLPKAGPPGCIKNTDQVKVGKMDTEITKDSNKAQGSQENIEVIGPTRKANENEIKTPSELEIRQHKSLRSTDHIEGILKADDEEKHIHFTEATTTQQGSIENTQIGNSNPATPEIDYNCNLIAQQNYEAEASLTSATMQTPNTSSSNVVTPESKVITSVANDVTSESKVVTSVTNDVTSESIVVTNDATSVSSAVTSVADDITFASNAVTFVANAISSVSSGATFDKQWILERIKEQLNAEIERRFNELQTKLQRLSLNEILKPVNNPEPELERGNNPPPNKIDAPFENLNEIEIPINSQLIQDTNQSSQKYTSQDSGPQRKFSKEIQVPKESFPREEIKATTQHPSRDIIQATVDCQYQDTIEEPVERQPQDVNQVPKESHPSEEIKTTTEQYENQTPIKNKLQDVPDEMPVKPQLQDKIYIFIDSQAKEEIQVNQDNDNDETTTSKSANNKIDDTSDNKDEHFVSEYTELEFAETIRDLASKWPYLPIEDRNKINTILREGSMSHIESSQSAIDVMEMMEPVKEPGIQENPRSSTPKSGLNVDEVRKRLEHISIDQRHDLKKYFKYWCNDSDQIENLRDSGASTIRQTTVGPSATSVTENDIDTDVDSILDCHPTFNIVDKPLRFHKVHGENLILSDNDFKASRKHKKTNCLINGAAFSSRPVRINEQICLHIKDISNIKLGVITIGFTSRDPNTIADEPPIRNYTETVNFQQTGFWSVRLDKSFYKKGDILHYHVDETGTLHFGVNLILKGKFYLDVDVRQPVWAFLDILGYSTTLKFVNDVIDYNLLVIPPKDLPTPRFNKDLIPLKLHTRKGDNVRFLPSYEAVAKLSSELNNGYVFSLSPMSLEQVIIVHILSMGSGNEWLPIGVTTCDPSTLKPNNLFGDIENIAPSAIWMLFKNEVNFVEFFDELAISLTKEGNVVLARNDEEPVTLGFINRSDRVWMFVELSGSIQLIKVWTTQRKGDGPANTTL